jgi:hypothetical protein
VRVPTLNLNNSANVLVQQYGPEDALLMAAKRADALLELGDVDGHRVPKGFGWATLFPGDNEVAT